MSARMVQRERRVSRVLVMLEYGEGDPCNGEVFDLTALASELAAKDEKHQSSKVDLTVRGRTDYAADRLPNGTWPLKVEAAWDVMVAFNSSGEAGWLDDAVNASMARLETADATVIMKSIRKQERKLAQLKQQLKEQRLAEAASIRMSHPVCRITANPISEAIKTDDAQAGKPMLREGGAA